MDYASWIEHLSTRQIHDIANAKLGKPFEAAFRERFGSELPEVLNESHSLVIVAGEFDASSRRIVEYLAEVHDIAINTAFFSVFEQNGETLLATDWLLDQEEVTQRAESKAKAPWSGLWYYNVGQDNERSWEDMRRYRFIAAGGSRYYSDFLKKLSLGDRVFAYQKQAGYVGYGIVTAPSVPVRDFAVEEKPILQMQLESRGMGHDPDDLDKCEYLVGMEWRKTFPLSEAKTFAGVFANQNVVCKLRDTATIEFLQQSFSQEVAPVKEESTGGTMKNVKNVTVIFHVDAYPGQRGFCIPLKIANLLTLGNHRNGNHFRRCLRHRMRNVVTFGNELRHLHK